jgi:hypothetical protein
MLLAKGYLDENAFSLPYK